MTSAERNSQAIAKALVKALARIETFMDDPSMILEDSVVFSIHTSQGVRDAVEALRKHYEGEE
jgi:GR25 family glycosyltransferase involved in LPS biosynthesis